MAGAIVGGGVSNNFRQSFKFGGRRTICVMRSAAAVASSAATSAPLSKCEIKSNPHARKMSPALDAHGDFTPGRGMTSAKLSPIRESEKSSGARKRDRKSASSAAEGGRRAAAKNTSRAFSAARPSRLDGETPPPAYASRAASNPAIINVLRPPTAILNRGEH